MDSTTCTAAVVTPYPSPASQAHPRAGSRPQSSRRPSPPPPQPPSPAQSCLSRGFMQRACPSPPKLSSNSRQTLVKLSSNAHERSYNAHEHTPMSAIPHHRPSPESRQLQCRQTHANSRQSLTNAHTTLMQTHTHVGHPSSQPVIRITPTAVQTISRKLSSNAHERSHNAHERTPMSTSPHHSPSPESHALQFTQTHPNSRQTLTNAHTTLMNTHPHRPAAITSHHPNHTHCSSHNLTQTLVKRSQTLTGLS